MAAALPFVPCETATAQEASTAFPEAGKSYTLRTCTQNGTCIQEELDGTLTVSSYDPTIRCFWEFIPTGEAHRYYIRNLTTGRYIQSTNIAQSSPVTTGTEPVEFYVGQDNNTAGATTNGYWYMSSTDNTVFDQVSDQTIGLNRGGGGSFVVAYMCGSGRGNSYWNIEETPYAYEVHPFVSSTSVGKAQLCYAINASTGKNVTLTDAGGLELQEASGEKTQSWYFVGESNASGGYLIVSSTNNQVLSADNTLTADSEAAQRWNVFEATKDGATYYLFRPTEVGTEARQALTVDGDSLFSFAALRTDFQLSHQIYNLPCGTQGKSYIRELSMSGEGVIKPIVYPIGSLNGLGTAIIRPNTRPSGWYSLYTKNKGIVARGKSFDITATLSTNPTEDDKMFVYFDWNRDGVFESATELTGNAREFTATINVPADAKLGQSRMRFRLTDNGLTGAEDDVNGQTWDLVISTVDAVDGYTVSVSTSSEERGSVAISPAADTYESGASVTATATAKGNSEFVCWREGNDVVSLDAEYPFTVTHSTQLTAYFTPKTSDVPIGIDDATSESKALVTIDQDNNVINIVTDAVVKAVNIYSTDGALIAKTTAKRIALDQYPLGTYIVKVITDGAETQAKVLLK